MDGDGRIYDVQGPFESEEEFAGLAGGPARRRSARSRRDALRARRHQRLRQSAVAMGRRHLRHGRDARRRLSSLPRRNTHCTKSSSPPSRGPTNRLLDVVIVLDTIAGVLVVLGAAWLVWTRPGPMTWGFFVYVIQFNPGQAFQFWAWLQLWPRALLAQNVIFLVMQAAAYTGLLAVCAEGAGRPSRRAMADDRARPARLWRSCSWASRSPAWRPSSAIPPKSGREACC